MSVIVQRHGDVGMSHDVLQVFGVHSSLGKPSAESVPHGMGRDVRQGLIRLVVLVVLPDKPLEHALVRYTYYTAPWAHCQPASSNNLQFVNDFLKLLALDLEAVAVHNEPVGVRVFLG